MTNPPDTPMSLADVDVRDLIRTFDLDPSGRLSGAAVARGRIGEIWRLDTPSGSWAVKQVGEVSPEELTEILEGARFQEAAVSAGVPAPAVRRATTGDLIGEVSGLRVRLVAWVEMDEPSPDVDPAAMGRLVAGLHRVPFDGSIGLDPWYADPVGEARWQEVVAALRGAHAPFADELDALRPEIAALEGLLGGAPRSLRTCHRDLWADNVRFTGDGSLCVFDFDNAGLAEPSQELAAVLVEYADADPARGSALRDAYEDAGGPGRVEQPTDFAMPIAQLLHILDEGCRRWLAATSVEDRADNEGWVREFLARPLTRSVIDTLLPG
jgi:Ser/Thr protein kinase RdoA (MazF antagonist)